MSIDASLPQEARALQAFCAWNALIVSLTGLRRTVADALLNRIGAAPWIVDNVILGHARPKLLRTYMPTLPLGEARDALQKWGDELAAILERAPSLRRALPEAHTLPL